MLLDFFLSPVVAFFLLTITLSFHLPTSLAVIDDRYVNCSSIRSCGNIRRIRYPFWGNGIAKYCGVPGLGLRCLADSAEIEIQSQTYRVLHINRYDNQTLRMLKTDPWTDNCPSQFINVSIPSNLFIYSRPGTQTLTLFYNCPLIPEISENKFICSMYKNNYFWSFDTDIRKLNRNLSRCNVSVVVPVLESVVKNFTSSLSTIEQLLKYGFDAEYITNLTACDNCGYGACGYDSNISQPVCFCRDGKPSCKYDSGSK